MKSSATWDRSSWRCYCYCPLPFLLPILHTPTHPSAVMTNGDPLLSSLITQILLRRTSGCSVHVRCVLMYVHPLFCGRKMVRDENRGRSMNGRPFPPSSSFYLLALTVVPLSRLFKCNDDALRAIFSIASTHSPLVRKEGRKGGRKEGRRCLHLFP